MASTLESAIALIARGLNLADQVLRGDDGPRELLGALGWDLPPSMDDIGLRALDLSAVLNDVQTLDVAIDAGTGGVTLAGDYAKLAVSFANFVQGIDALVAGFSAGGDYLTKTNIPNEFATRFLDFLAVQVIASDTMMAFSVANFLGIVELKPFPEDDSIYQIEHIRRIVHWDRLPRVFTDIKGLLAEVHAWGSPGFDATPLVLALGAIFQGICANTAVRALPRRAEWALVGHDVPEADTSPATQLLLSITRGLTTGLDAGISVIALRPSAPGGSDAGFAIAPYLFGTTDLKYPLSDTVNFVLDATLDIESGLAFVLRAGSSAQIINNFVSGGAIGKAADGHLLLSIEYAPGGGKQAPVLSLTDGIGVNAQSISVGGGADVSGGVLSPMAFAKLKGGQFYMDSSQMDSFLASMIPISANINFDFGVGWSSANGFYFDGSASAALTIPLHDSFGPFDVETMHLEIGMQGDTLPLELSLTGSGSLGPFSISVDRIGLQFNVAFHKGNLGPFNLDLSFKPPNGLGMELDAGLISGGGYLSIDQQHHRYAGVLECSIADIVQVKIIGILDTVMPDGSPGFALLLVITTDFPPIQLSFGFTLNGVGGIGGINRTMNQDALRAGLHAHQMNSILFPNDPVANAPQIISNLGNFFPPADGRYLFGPMFSLGWGTPTLITLNLGIILEIPDPIRLAILGEINAALPYKDVALLQFNIDVLGTIDFGIGLFTIDGSMFDSYVLVFSISGDLALRLSWGDNPNFAFSLGGLHPKFQPPPNFPKMTRCTVSICDGDNPRLSSTSYFAVTSNSVQFGANTELYAAAGGFSVHGWIGFDCLFIFEPFSFEFDYSAGLDIEFEGDSLASIRVDGSVSGPHPWHVHGDASLHILLFDVSASVDLHWGDEDPVTLPKVQVLPDLLGALGDSQNWSTQLPPEGAPSVSLTPRTPGDKTLVVHPLGTLQVREKVVPLDQTITKYGNARPSDGTYFSISGVKIGETAESTVTLTDNFAIGQFTDLTNDQRITTPSYQLMDSGVSIGSATATYSKDVPCIVAYQDGYLDDDNIPLRIGKWFLMPLDVHLAYSRLGAGFVNGTRTKGVRSFTNAGTTSPISVGDMKYVIASMDDLSTRSDILGDPATQYEAMNALQAHLSANPADRGALQVVTLSEVAA